MELVVLSPTISAAAPVAVRYRLIDPSFATLRVEIDFSIDGVDDFAPCSPSSTIRGEPLDGLAASPAGLDHTFYWDAPRDLGAPTAPAVHLRLSFFGALPGGVATVGPFAVVPAAPASIAIDSIRPRMNSGEVDVELRLVDPGSDLARVAVDYSLDGEQTFQPASEAVSSEPRLRPLVTSPAGVTHRYVWDVARDLASTEASGVILRASLTNRAGTAGVTSSPFDLSARPRARIVAVRASSASIVPVIYTLADPAERLLGITARYSTDGGQGFSPATELRVAESEGIVGLASSVSGSPHRFVWDARNDLPGGVGTGVVFAIEPQADQPGVAGTSQPFAVGIDTPPRVAVRAPSGPTTPPVAVRYELTDPDADPIDVSVRYSTDSGQTYQPASEATTAYSQGTSALSTSFDGEAHVFVWDAERDLGGAGATGVLIHVEVSGGGFAISVPVDIDPALAGLAARIYDPIAGEKRPPLPIRYRLRDPASAPADIEVSFSIDGGTTFRPATGAPSQLGNEGTSGLSTSPDGNEHIYVWDAARDLSPPRVDGVLLRIAPAGGAGRGDTCGPIALVVEDPVSIAIDAPAGGAHGAPVSIRYRLFNLAHRPCRLEVLYSTDGGRTFEPATESTRVASDGLTGLATHASGQPHVFAWDAALDLGEAEARGPLVRLQAFGPSPGVPVVSAPFDLENTRLARVTVRAPSGGATGFPVAVRYDVSDPAGAPVHVEVSYSIDGGVTFLPASEAQGYGSHGSTSLPASAAGTPHLFVWDAARDLPASSVPSAQIRVQAVSPEGVSSTASGPFTPDPSAPGAPPVPGSTPPAPAPAAPPPVYTIRKLRGDGQTIASGLVFPRELIAQVVDANGQPVVERLQYRVVDDPAHARIELELLDYATSHTGRDIPPVVRALPGATGPDASRPAVVEVSMFSNPSVTARFQLTVTRPEIRVTGTGSFGASFLDPGQPAVAIRADTGGAFSIEIGPGLSDPRRPVKLAVEAVGLLLSEEVVWAGQGSGRATVGFTPLPLPHGQMGHTATFRVRSTTDPTIAPVSIDIPVELRMNADRLVPAFAGVPGAELALHLRPVSGLVGGGVPLAVAGNTLPDPFNVELVDQHGTRYTRAVRDHYESCTQAPVTDPFRVSWFAGNGGTFSERLEPGQFGNVHFELGKEAYFTPPDQHGQHQGPWFVQAQVSEWAPEDPDPPRYEQRDSQGNLIRCVRHNALQLRGSPTYWSWSFPVRPLRQADALSFEVRRLGEYPGRFWQHARRPILGDRHADAALAAEILVYPVNVPTHPGIDVIGKRFRATFTIPEGLAFDGGLTVRAYFDDYRHDLTDYQELTGAPSVVIDPAAPHRVTVDVTSDRPIHAVHLTKLRYRNLGALRGYAVSIEMTYTHFDVREAYALAAAPGVPLAAPRDVRGTGKLINLVLMPRDLGRCEGSNGFDTLSAAGDHHNVPNGNLYLEVPVIATFGAGVNTDVRICHNSLLAIFEESLRAMLVEWGGGGFLARPDDYGTGWRPGGWTHSYHVNLREHVQPLDDQGSGVVPVIDLAAPDGNRILFERKTVEGADPTLGLGNYDPVFPGTLWLGDPALGCSLRLRKEAAADGTIGFLLRDLDGNRWRFDASGRLVEIGDRLTEASTVVDPLKITYPGVTVDVQIADSSGRVTQVRGNVIYTPDGFWSELSDSQLLIGRRPLVVEAGQGWFLWRETPIRLEGNRTVPLLSKLRDPTGRDNEYTYYSDSDFEGVPAATARQFWGRLGKFERGVAPDRRARLWRYQAVLTGGTQKVVYRNAARTETVITYRRENLAVEQSELVVQERDPVTLELRHRPNYDQVLAGGGSLPLRSLIRLDYKEKTKLVRSTTDAAGNVTVGEYVAVQGGPGFLLQRSKPPDGTVWETEYDADNRVFNVYNPDHGQRGTLFTEYTYGDGGLLIARTHPILTVDGQPVTATESWNHAPQTLLLDYYTDVTGTHWDLGYGAPGRDPGVTHLPTSRSVDIDGRTLTWELGYDVLGRAVESYEPLFGGTTRTAYHPLGPLLRVDHQAIPDAAGQEKAAIHFDVVDRLRRLVCVVDPQGGVACWDYNQHGDLAQHHKGPGRITSATYRGDGVLLSATDEAGMTIRYVSDELGRAVRIDYPVPDDRPAGERSQAFSDVIVYDDANGKTTSRRHETAGPGQPLGTLVSEEVMTYRHGRLVEQASSLKPGSRTVKLAIAYDARGNQREITQYDGSVAKRTVTFGIDAWGRVTETVTTADGETRTEKVTYDNAGRVVAQTHPDTGGVGTGISVLPKAGYGYDPPGRLTHVKNSLGEVVRQIEYHDSGNRSSTTSGAPAHHRELGQDPALPVANPGPLVFIRRTDFNRRGLPTTISFDDAPGTDDKVTYFYAGSGLVLREEYAGGRKIHYTYDGAGRPTTIEKEVRRRAPGVPWETFNAAHAPHVESRRQVVQQVDYDPRGEVRVTTDERGLRERRIVDRIGRLMQVDRRQADAWVTTEALTYDALGRVTRRRGQGNALQTFTFSDSGRTLLWKLTNLGSWQEWELKYDWEHKLTSFEQREYRAMFVGIVPAKPTHTQTFNGFGQLRSKEWLQGTTRLARIEYDYAGDLIWRRKVEVLRTLPDGTLGDYVRTTSFHYDADGRLTHMQGGGQDYRFDYNIAGVLKALRRPLRVTTSTGTNLVLGNATRFSHDQKGQLTTILEERGSDEAALATPVVELSRASLHYQTRPQLPWEADVPPAWLLAGKDLGAGPGSLRGVTIGRPFAPPGPPGEYVRDYVRDGEGQVTAAISRSLQEGTRASVDSRHEEGDARNQVRGIRRYRSRSLPGGTYESFSYEVTSETQEPDGRLVRRASTRTPATPRDRLGQFQETHRYDPVGMPLDRYHVEEDQSAAATGGRAVPAPLQDYRQFVHDAAGRLAVMRITRHRRKDGDTADFNPSHAQGPGDSQPIDVIHYYAPDGELMWRSVKYWPVARGHTQITDTLIVSDGSAAIAEYDYTAWRLRYFESIPGTGVRLSAESYFHGVGADSLLYYRNGHEGATHFMTDERGEPVADFGLAAHDGEADLFGRRQSPHVFGLSMSALTLEARQRELWSYYQPQSPRVDLVAGQPLLWQREMQERMQSVGAPSALGAANNPYGFSPEQEFAYYDAADDPFTLGQGYSTFDSIVQHYIDVWRGLGDVISFGLTAQAREWLWGKRRGGVVNKYSYVAGQAAGIAWQFVSGMIAFRAVGAAARLLQAYIVAGDVHGVVQGTRAVRSGTATWWDFLGFLPMVGYGVGAARAVRGGAQAAGSTASHAASAGHVAPAVSAVQEAAPASRLMGGSTDLYRETLLAQIQADRAANLGVDASGALRSLPGPLTSGVYEQTRRARVGLEMAAQGNKKLLNKNIGGELSQVDGIAQGRPLVSGVKYTIEGFAPPPTPLGFLAGRPIMLLPFRWLGFWRYGDTEFRVLEPIFRRTTGASKGFIEIMTDRFPCPSCWDAILAFQREHRGVDVIVTYLRPPILRKDGTHYAQAWFRDPT